ncbi:MAG: hypothetical protein H6661_13565 [Ardenticatenaceae bacterium]|nr:hypothetical protein [Ardenticatenaceae bacterium]
MATAPVLSAIQGVARRRRDDSLRRQTTRYQHHRLAMVADPALRFDTLSAH